MTRETTRALAGAARCLAGLVALGLAVYSPAGILLDEHSMRAFTRLYEPSAQPAATAFVNLGGPAMAVLFCLALAATALVRGRPRLAALALIVPAGAALSTGVLKHTLAQSRVCVCLADDRVGSGAWPSGHATIATALVLAAVIVAAPRWRPRVALVGGGTLAAFYGALLVMGWHYPSDVLGGLLMGALWALAGIGALAFAERRSPSLVRPEVAPGPRTALALVTGFTAVTFCAGAAVLARPLAAEAYEHSFGPLLVAATIVTAACGVLTAGFALALRR
jgi:membrane-associated phospholipid phosphatase